MIATARTESEAALDIGDKPMFRAVLIYQDLAAGKRANEFCDKLARRLEDDCGISQQMWNFNVLAVPEIRNIAASAAAAADIVVLSISSATALPAKVKEWIEMWLWLVDLTRPALVALFGSPSGTNEAVVAYLRNAARRKGIDFFSHATLSAVAGHTNQKRAKLGRP
jgi:hypothetical protein